MGSEVGIFGFIFKANRYNIMNSTTRSSKMETIELVVTQNSHLGHNQTAKIISHN